VPCRVSVALPHRRLPQNAVGKDHLPIPIACCETLSVNVSWLVGLMGFYFVRKRVTIRVGPLFNFKTSHSLSEITPGE